MKNSMQIVVSFLQNVSVWSSSGVVILEMTKY